MLPGMRSAQRFTALALALGLALAACSPGATQAPSAASSDGGAGAPASGSAVTIKGFAFDPASATVSVGSTVTWTNEDSATHTVTADDGSFDSKSVATGQVFSQVFDKAGTYAYHCAIHTSMKATIVVQ